METIGILLDACIPDDEPETVISVERTDIEQNQMNTCTSVSNFVEDYFVDLGYPQSPSNEVNTTDKTFTSNTERGLNVIPESDNIHDSSELDVSDNTTSGNRSYEKKQGYNTMEKRNQKKK